MSLSVELVAASAVVISWFTIYVGRGVKHIWPDQLPGDIASWSTPSIVLCCCVTTAACAYTEEPKAWVIFWLSVFFGVLTLFTVWLYWCDKKHEM